MYIYMIESVGLLINYLLLASVTVKCFVCVRLRLNV